ncbi:hypothetical protein GF420_06940 [candidate division GN15 bacterium]|nr:hypothetical protein [candidate division GN15 bacterium]
MHSPGRVIVGGGLVLIGLASVAAFDSIAGWFLTLSADADMHRYSLLQIRIMLAALLPVGLVVWGYAGIAYWLRRIQRPVMKTPERRFLICWLLAAVGLRLVSLLLFDIPLTSDAFDYHTLAAEWVRHGCYCVEGLPTAYRPVGYPAILAAIYAIAGVAPLAGALFNLIPGVAICLLGYLLAKQWLSHATARVSLMILVLLPSVILWTNLLMSELWFTALLLAAVLCGTMRQVQWVASGGILLGLAALVRPIAVFVPVPMIAFWWLQQRSLPKTAIRIGAVVLLMVAVTWPWMNRNAREVGGFTLTTSTGVNLYIGNHPGASVGYQTPDPDLFDLSDPRRESVNDSLGTALALEHISSHPNEFITRGLGKIAWLFAYDAEPLREHLVNSSGARRGLLEVLAMLVQAFYLLLWLAALGGMWRLAIGRDWLALSLPLLLVLYWSAVHFVFFGGGRFHTPLLPFLAFLAAVWTTRNWVDKPQKRRPSHSS